MAMVRQKTKRRSRKAEVRQPFEYVLLIAPKFNERKNKTVTRVAIRTVKEFTNFAYELIVDTRMEDRRLILGIRGLRAPQLTFPAVGPATFESEFDDLLGNYEVAVSKLGKEVNVFRVDIRPENVTLEKKPAAGFVDVVTRPEEW